MVPDLRQGTYVHALTCVQKTETSASMTSIPGFHVYDGADDKRLSLDNQ